MKDAATSGCPVMGHGEITGTRVGGALGSRPTLEDWWPRRLQVELLHQNADQAAPANPLGADFNYAEAFKTLDLDAVKRDIFAMLTDSQPWWPADYGHYGPQMIRMAWHAAGTYRVADGRGGAGRSLQRYLPLNSWIDNGNIDKSRRLLWPIKQKYGNKLSWADLMILTGNCALESMGFETLGFGGGRIDNWEPDNATYWGPEQEMLGRARWDGKYDEAEYDLENPLAASEMSLIYVNPEGPGASGDPLGSAREIRITFGRMAMNDEETVALIVGGHTFGKSHGAVSADKLGPPPEDAGLEEQGFGWMNPVGTGNAEFTTTNGIEGAWTSNPIRWDNEYLENLFGFEWEMTKSPAGASQWKPKGDEAADKVPDAHREGVRHPPMMMTSDIALRTDPVYAEIAKRFLEHPEQLEQAFAKAWYKLTHRDMGPKTRLLGAHVPSEEFLWQDPVPTADHPLVDASDLHAIKSMILTSGLSVSALVSTAWASASTFRGSDYRGGANGARVRLAPQKDWAVNRPGQLAETLHALEQLRTRYNDAQGSHKSISMADLIVLGGCAAIEKAASDAGVDITVPFTPGRTDASAEQTDEENIGYLEPFADGFRNYLKADDRAKPEELLIDKANLLTLTAPEMTVLLGGMRVLGTNFDGAQDGVFTDRPGVLSTDFFRHLLDMSTVWKPLDGESRNFEGRDRATGARKWTASRVDLVFGSDPQLRAVCEVYAQDDGHERFVRDFVTAWDKVMMLDRFELLPGYRKD